MIRQRCSCGKSYQLKDEMVGRKVKCPACQAVFTVAPQAEEVAQAELVPMDPPPRPGTYPTLQTAADPLAPLAAGNAFGTLPAAGPAMTALGSPWTSPGGPLSAAPAPARGRIFPWWLWVGAGVTGVAAIGSVLLVVVVFIRMNQPNPGNIATNVPISAPQLPQKTPEASDFGPFALPTDTVGADFGNWQVYSSDAGGYSINLPGKPQVTPQSTESPFGPIEESVVIIGSKRGGLVVTAAHTDMPFDAAKLTLDRVMASTLRSGTVIRSTDVQISGRPGREYLVNYSDGTSKGLHRGLTVNGRIYFFGYITRLERFNEADAHKCLETFTITKEPPPVESTYAPLVAGPGVPLQRNVAWITHESKSGEFKVDMPATPTNVTEHVALLGGRHSEAIACEIQGKGAFVVAVSRQSKPILPEGLPSFVESLRLSRLSQGKLINETTTTQESFSVHDLTLEPSSDSRHVVRFYVSPEWYYSVTWFGPVGEATSEEVKRFFASFTLLAPAGTP
jgi:hypothetical protein